MEPLGSLQNESGRRKEGNSKYDRAISRTAYIDRSGDLADTPYKFQLG